jgi:hypothetical protein
MRTAGAGLAILAAACGGDAAGRYAIPGDRGPAIVVEVLNASGEDGAARAGTRLLRRAGIDVVYFGNADRILDSTRIIVRRGDARAAERVRAILKTGRVELELDSGRLVDASVLLGADFTPPSLRDFHP